MVARCLPASFPYMCKSHWHACVGMYDRCTHEFFDLQMCAWCFSECRALPIEQLAGVQPRAEQPEPGVHARETGLAGCRSWLAIIRSLPSSQEPRRLISSLRDIYTGSSTDIMLASLIVPKLRDNDKFSSGKKEETQAAAAFLPYRSGDGVREHREF